MLKMTEASSLALHTMVLMAGQKVQRISAKEVAYHLHASEAHVAKVMQRLARSGLLTSCRGPRGGFCISRDKAKISLYQILQAVEKTDFDGPCLYKKRICNGKTCIFGGLLTCVRRQVKSCFQNTSLQKVAGWVQPRRKPIETQHRHH